MVRRIIWSAVAIQERSEILKYWSVRNKSKVFSKKLYVLLVETAERISVNPTIGHLTNRTNTRIKIVRDYLIVYKIDIDDIKILSIIDGRRNPEEITKRF